MKKTIAAANWKMNLLRPEAASLVKEVIKAAENLDVFDRVELVIAPPFTSLDTVQKVMDGTRAQLCAQNVFWKESGAFTGEISPLMLVDAGCQWVIIGHSERRHIMNETDDMINMKIKSSIKNGLGVILCVGETREEKENGITMQIINKQLQAGLDGIDAKDIDKLVIAYEPVWAIGTGLNARPEDAEIVHKYIKEVVRTLFDSYNDGFRVIYGGSVNTGNIKSLVSQPNIDGVLVGGASLDKEAFTEIIKISGE